MLPCDRLQGGELEAEPEGHLPVLRVERFGRDQEAQGTGGGPIQPPCTPFLSSPFLSSGPRFPARGRGGGRRRRPWVPRGAGTARCGHGSVRARRWGRAPPPALRRLPPPGAVPQRRRPPEVRSPFPGTRRRLRGGEGKEGGGGRGEPRGDGHGPARGGALCRREEWGKEAQWLREAGGS